MHDEHLVFENYLLEEMVKCGMPHVLHHQEHVHVMPDTLEKDRSEMQKKKIENEVDAFRCFIDENMLNQVVKQSSKARPESKR